MPFISFNISPEMKRTNALLERIAHVLERITVEHFGIPLKETGEPNEKDTTFVSYTDDKAELRKELEKELGLEKEPETEDVL